MRGFPPIIAGLGLIILVCGLAFGWVAARPAVPNVADASAAAEAAGPAEGEPTLPGWTDEARQDVDVAQFWEDAQSPGQTGGSAVEAPAPPR